MRLRRAEGCGSSGVRRDSSERGDAPGMPRDGSWTVRAEGLARALSRSSQLSKAISPSRDPMTSKLSMVRSALTGAPTGSACTSPPVSGSRRRSTPSWPPVARTGRPSRVRCERARLVVVAGHPAPLPRKSTAADPSCPTNRHTIDRRGARKTCEWFAPDAPLLPNPLAPTPVRQEGNRTTRSSMTPHERTPTGPRATGGVGSTVPQENPSRPPFGEI